MNYELYGYELWNINYQHGDTEDTEKGTAERRIFSVSPVQGKSLPKATEEELRSAEQRISVSSVSPC
jgi:hypothetical protein